ncbi:MAG: MBOAT family protein [Planctomycetaceae bacterium]|nr:MBOAT family protein [Planctomycetaceae bacterium]
MSFLDPWFYLGLAIVAAAYWLAPQKFRMPLLLAGAASWLLYASPLTLIVFAALGMFVHIGGVWIAHGNSDRSRGKRKWVASGVLVVSAVVARLIFPDIFGGLTLSLHEISDQVFKLLGFAYVVLKAHHVFVIAKADSKPPRNLLDTVHYLIYLPTLSAGPILRLREWRMLNTVEFAPAHFEIGVKRTLWGLFKKVVIVAMLLECDGWLEGRPGWWVEPAILVVGLFTIYFDFSGYTDIAIGVARMFGHKLPENFKSPFAATSLSHFWRKWHISMGDWIREHVFIPLGGMRAKGGRLYALLFGSMLFCGLWHAFEWRFVLWGLYHGILLALEQMISVHPLPQGAPWHKTLLRRAFVLAVMVGSTAFFIRRYWE